MNTSPPSFVSFRSRSVPVGNIAIGGHNPIRVQSMTNTNTNDIDASFGQCRRIIDAGGELVRLTVQGPKEVESIRKIREKLRAAGYMTPVVADVHFNPAVAEAVAPYVEKLRINPGNYADKRARFQHIEYTDTEYQAELQRISERIKPLVELCKQYHTAIRIGVNHGSLSDRIMSRYGNTPEGMVQAAMEFLTILRGFHFHDIVLSLKASNVRVMVQAYRLLVSAMMAQNMDYPLHLGVTEAGSGREGRVKSAIGIGTLLADGLGDTIRVSLTEAPEKEIPVARTLADHYAVYHNQLPEDYKEINYPVFSYQRRTTHETGILGKDNVPRVMLDYSQKDIRQPDIDGMGYVKQDGQWYKQGAAVELLYVGRQPVHVELPGEIMILQDVEAWSSGSHHVFPVYTFANYNSDQDVPEYTRFLKARPEELNSKNIELIKKDSGLVLMLVPGNSNVYHDYRRVFNRLIVHSCRIPVVLTQHYPDDDSEAFIIKCAADLGPLFTDGLGEGICLSAGSSSVSSRDILALSYTILQASRIRITQTEFISCPGCGRTLFSLEETLNQVKSHTSHLKGLKIAVMGCIVNGPGEMADADYGYVGSGKGKVTLYKKKEIQKRNIPQEEAVDELIQLIKDNGDWHEA